MFFSGISHGITDTQGLKYAGWNQQILSFICETEWKTKLKLEKLSLLTNRKPLFLPAGKA